MLSHIVGSPFASQFNARRESSILHLFRVPERDGVVISPEKRNQALKRFLPWGLILLVLLVLRLYADDRRRFAAGSVFRALRKG